MNRNRRNAVEAGLIVLAGAALVWIGGAGAVADQSPPRSAPVGDASRPVDRDCRDFTSAAEAQAALRAGDPERLDADRDGVACEELFGTGGQQVKVRPKGPVQTGGFPPG